MWTADRPGASNQIASKITRGASFPSEAQNLCGKTLSRYQAVALAANGSGVAAWESSLHGGSGWQIRASTMSASGRCLERRQEPQPGRLGRLRLGAFRRCREAVAPFVAWNAEG